MAKIFHKIPSWLSNKYSLAIVLFLLFMLLLDDNNVFRQFKLYKEEKKLEAATIDLKLKIKDLQKTTSDLQKNPFTIEKIAREKYGMKKEKETVFLLPDAEKSQKLQ